MRSIFPFSTLSLRKWYLTSMCLVLEWSTGFLATLWHSCYHTWEVHGNTPHQSHSACIWSKAAESNNKRQLHTRLVVHCATLDCLREDQETSKDPKNWQVPEVDLLSTRHPAKSTSEKPRSEREEDVEYQRPSLGVYRRYLKIRLMACRCEVLGNAWKRAHRHTEN
jgi:hypothetical protein